MLNLDREKIRNDLIALLLFAAFASIRFLSDSSEVQWTFLYVIPIGLLAYTHGLAGGVIGALIAMFLFGLRSVLIEPAPLYGWLTRSVAWFFVGIGVGMLERARHRTSFRAEGWFELSSDLLAELDSQGRFVRVNGRWTEQLGYPASSLLGHRYTEFIHPDDVEASILMEKSLVGDEMETSGFENRFVATDGSWHWLLWSTRVKRNQIFASGRDITDRKLSEQEREEKLSVEHSAARLDDLTGLPNRRAWEEEIEKHQSRVSTGRSDLAIAILDLDHFKVLNDTQGHAAGDEYLRMCANEWSSVLRSTDLLARIGGEEFGVLMPRCPEHLAIRVVERIRTKTPPPQTCSAGVALHERNEPIADTIERADRGLYRAKSEGRDQTVFQPASQARQEAGRQDKA